MVRAEAAYQLAADRGQQAAPDAEGGIWSMSQSETVTPKNPPTPPLKKGGTKPINISSSPFAKGGPRGILME
jgi:hypothetical protein